nr:unnamed protein product [Haemonchus contortus]
MLGETRGGSRGDKKHGFGAEGVPSWKVAYKRWQGKQIPEDLVAHRTSKRTSYRNGRKCCGEKERRLDLEKTEFFSSAECTESIGDGLEGAIDSAQDFRYFGSDLARDGSVEEAIISRIDAARLK